MYLVERLRADGWAVRALVRDAGAASSLLPAGIELAAGDLLDAGAVTRAASGCDVVFHAAAVVVSGGGWERYRRMNVDGTRVVIDAAERAGARLVHVSSVAVYGPTARYRGGERTDEDTPLAPLPASAHYARSKRESESLVLDAHGAGRVWATALRPDVIYGRHDRQFVPRIARLLRRGILPVVGDGGSALAVVHSANVADAIVRAASLDAAGGRAYNVANEGDVSAAEFMRLGAQALGQRVRTVRVPPAFAEAGLRVAGITAALAGRGDLRDALRSSFDFLTRGNPFSSERAYRELGWAPPVAPKDGILDAFAWLRERGSGS